MKRPGTPVGFILIGINALVIVGLWFWPNPPKPPVDIEPDFEPGWRLPERPVKIATFNVGFGKLLDDALAILGRESADIVCLQEIPSDQVATVEARLGMSGCWHQASNQNGDVFYGNALFARGRVSDPQSFPNPEGGSYGIWAAVEVDGARFLVGSVHLSDLKSPRAGYPRREREIKAMHEAIGRIGAPTLVAGDFNNPPTSINYNLMTKRLKDLSKGSGPTHASRLPIFRVDYVFGTPEWERVSSKSIKTTVSDHFPVVAVVKAAENQESRIKNRETRIGNRGRRVLSAVPRFRHGRFADSPAIENRESEKKPRPFFERPDDDPLRAAGSPSATHGT